MTQFLSPRSQLGQAIVLAALAMMVFLGAIGIAIDAGTAYYYDVEAERAAGAAALSGVIFMPTEFSPAQAVPAGSANDATDRALAEAKRNGFDTANTANHVQVVPAQVTGQTNQLQVTVSRTVPTSFMNLFGIVQYTVQRSAIAEYLPPISLGQPGGQIGSTVSQLGSGNNYYFMREEGWASDRSQGDAFTPNPNASTDVHQISAQVGTDTVDSTLPARGGYNYYVNLPAGGFVQVYNAAFAPDGDSGATHNTCENAKTVVFLIFLGSIGPCSSGGNYYYHEEDNFNPTDDTTYDTMEYTLFKVNNYFIHNQDTEVAQMKVSPIDATRWNQSSSQYTNILTNGTITQTYNSNGTPSNMLIYHAWADVATYAGPNDGGLVRRTMTWAGGALPAGVYRLRVDELNYNGTLPPGNGSAHKGYAVRALDASGSPCAACTVSAWNDMAYYTPITTSTGGSFTIPLFSLPPAYAGHTVSIDVYDPGDIGGGGNVDINILDPSGAISRPTAPATVGVYDLGTSRAYSGPTPGLIANQSTATFRATSAGTTLYNGQWVEMQVPIPSTYSPGTNPSNWIWSLQYQTSSSVTATDTVTVAVGLKGNPAHLLSS